MQHDSRSSPRSDLVCELEHGLTAVQDVRGCAFQEFVQGLDFHFERVRVRDRPPSIDTISTCAGNRAQWQPEFSEGCTSISSVPTMTSGIPLVDAMALAVLIPTLSALNAPGPEAEKTAVRSVIRAPACSRALLIAGVSSTEWLRSDLHEISTSDLPSIDSPTDAYLVEVSIWSSKWLRRSDCRCVELLEGIEYGDVFRECALHGKLTLLV